MDGFNDFISTNYGDFLLTTHYDCMSYNVYILNELTRLRSSVKIVKQVKQLTIKFLNKTTLPTILYPILNNDFQFNSYYYTDIVDKVLQIPNGVYYNGSDYLIVYHKYMLVTRELYDDSKLRSMLSTYILYHDMSDLKKKYDKRLVFSNNNNIKQKKQNDIRDEKNKQIIDYSIKNVNQLINFDYSIKFLKQQELQDNVILIRSDNVKNTRRVRMLRKINNIGVSNVDRSVVTHEFTSKFMYDDVLECSSQYDDQEDDEDDFKSIDNMNIDNNSFGNYDDDDNDDNDDDNDNDNDNDNEEGDDDDNDNDDKDIEIIQL